MTDGFIDSLHGDPNHARVVELCIKIFEVIVPVEATVDEGALALSLAITATATACGMLIGQARGLGIEDPSEKRLRKMIDMMNRNIRGGVKMGERSAAAQLGTAGHA